jgi:hypothetical protein
VRACVRQSFRPVPTGTRLTRGSSRNLRALLRVVNNQTHLRRFISRKLSLLLKHVMRSESKGDGVLSAGRSMSGKRIPGTSELQCSLQIEMGRVW